MGMQHRLPQSNIEVGTTEAAITTDAMQTAQIQIKVVAAPLPLLTTMKEGIANTRILKQIGGGTTVKSAHITIQTTTTTITFAVILFQFNTATTTIGVHHLCPVNTTMGLQIPVNTTMGLQIPLLGTIVVDAIVVDTVVVDTVVVDTIVVDAIVVDTIVVDTIVVDVDTNVGNQSLLSVM